jgi:uncharacterized protein YdeI (YjbR/CyaY-like superfamily)
MKKRQTVDGVMASSKWWKAELIELRSILRSTGLKETIKWGSPVYTHEGKNVVGIGGFKSYFGLWFFQGALLADKNKVLINAQEGRTRALRQMRLQSSDEIDARLIKGYVKEAIGLATRGVEIKADRHKPLTVPAELQAALRKRKTAGTGFEKLTPGKQREYAEYVASAKQAATKLKRINKILPMIKAGVGLNDKYRN